MFYKDAAFLWNKTQNNLTTKIINKTYQIVVDNFTTIVPLYAIVIASILQPAKTLLHSSLKHILIQTGLLRHYFLSNHIILHTSCVMDSSKCFYHSYI